MDLTKVSKKMSYLLRHEEDFTDGWGWADVSALVREIKKTYPEFHREILREIVAKDEKTRYSFDAHEMRIRANQGHSVKVDVELERRIPPEILYHGTGTKAVPSIMKEGLKKQSRLYVHLSPSPEKAKVVSSRRSRPVLLAVDAASMQADGCIFYRSVNDVWLTDYVAPKYLKQL